MVVALRVARVFVAGNAADGQRVQRRVGVQQACFIRQQREAGDSQAEVSRRLGMNLTTVAHHLSLLDLPPVLAAALKSGRCTSPRTLHELSKVHARNPEPVQALLDGPGDITREAVAALRSEAEPCRPLPSVGLIAQAVAACDRLEKLLGRVEPSARDADLAALRARLQALARWSPAGSDGQTP